ncbi:SIR2 family NAD-dependent protein deacylase, partial [Acinetobacter baumannii]
MSIPDQSHINHIRDLLWDTSCGGASVMIGAGFSLNANPISPSAKKFPLWSQVAKNLCSKLYPPSEQTRLKQALSEASGTSGFLRLAQEYEIAFGRGSLHNFIQESVPDLEHQPSELHYQLLELPWREVLTTNWDTLLERTQLEIPERSYSIVRTVDELSCTPSPRIIKLHGTVPSHIPFIFTEEDYRTYPKKFAPFVNTVQQIMMESTVLLLGFSGDDPNFLQWSGWVRDNLGDSAPKIYLAGWLGLSPHRRRMLENNNVVPIDIANHPKAHEWPEHLRHQYATEWIIKTLQYGQSYKSKYWPSTHNYTDSVINDYLYPIEKNIQNTPKSDSRIGLSDPISLEKFREILEIWEHNRSIYPDWIVLPIEKHPILDLSIQYWENEFLFKYDDLSDDEKFKFLTEIIWLYQIKLVPLPQEIDKKWCTFAKKINFTEKTINGVSKTSEWSKIQLGYINNSLYSLTTSRLALDDEAFNNKLLDINLFESYSIEIKNYLIHERCQWQLINLDFINLEKNLEIWNVENSDPIWMFRKASLLLELNLTYYARNLIIKGFTILKKNPDKSNKYTNSSREGWALLSIPALNFNNQEVYDLLKIKKFNLSERQDQLALSYCNTNDQISKFINNLNKRREDNEKISNPNFDLYKKRGETLRINNYKYQSICSAYQCILLTEVAGLPLRFNNFKVGIDLIGSVISNYELINLKLAMRLVIRLQPLDDDKLINNIYSRVSIACLEKDELDNLINQVNNLLNYVVQKYNQTPDLFWISYIRSCLEILSRLVIRLRNRELDDHLDQCIALINNINLFKHLWLKKPLYNYLKRCWEASSQEIRSERIYSLLELPIDSQSDLLFNLYNIIYDNKTTII